MSILYLDKMTWEEADHLDRQKSIFFFSLSPIEEHGPHLPLGTYFYGATDMLKLVMQNLEERESCLDVVGPPPLRSRGASRRPTPSRAVDEFILF